MFIDQVGKLRSRDDFAVVTVSLDEAATVGDVRRLINKNRIAYPVLWYGPDVKPWEASDWDVTGVPSAYMIDPRGSLAYELYVDETFAERATRLMDRLDSFPPYALSWSHHKLDDGSYRLDLDITSPAHLPLEVEIGIQQGLPAYYEKRGATWERVDPIPEGKQPNSTSYVALEGYDGLKQQVTFGEFGESRLSFTVRPGQDARSLMYYARIVVPETQGVVTEGGLSLMSQGNLFLEAPGQP